jgi:hypothetical protein
MDNWPGDKRQPYAPFGMGYRRLKNIGQLHDPTRRPLLHPVQAALWPPLQIGQQPFTTDCTDDDWIIRSHL